MSSSSAESEPSYVSGPNSRGTVDLLWNCFIAFGLCIWTVVHPNIIPWPRFRDQMLYKLTWLIAAVLSPELLVAVAFRQMVEAREIVKLWEENIEGAEAKTWLGMPGAFFAAMGGYTVVPTPVPPLHRASELNADNRPSTLVTTIRPSGFRKLLELKTINNHIQDGTLTKAVFSRRNISDKGKADSVAKVLFCVQIVWMCIQCLGRRLEGLPVTLLEGHVLIQILFAIIAHMCWWHKPLDVSEPIQLALTLDPEVLSRLVCVGPGREEVDARADLLTDEVSTGGFFRMFFRATYDALSYHSPQFEAMAALFGVVNGGLHLIAWNSHFPTRAEQLLWRISALSAGGLFPIFMLTVSGLSAEDPVVRMCLNMFLSHGDHLPNWSLFAGYFSALMRDVVDVDDLWAWWLPVRVRRMLVIFIWVALAWYIICMLYLTIGAFLCVRNLPKGSYAIVAWTDLLPHF
ncbi:hypothetical protein BJX62DRAFT_230720 [Aspergillus germanicus]